MRPGRSRLAPSVDETTCVLHMEWAPFTPLRVTTVSYCREEGRLARNDRVAHIKDRSGPFTPLERVTTVSCGRQGRLAPSLAQARRRRVLRWQRPRGEDGRRARHDAGLTDDVMQMTQVVVVFAQVCSSSSPPQRARGPPPRDTRVARVAMAESRSSSLSSPAGAPPRDAAECCRPAPSETPLGMTCRKRGSGVLTTRK